MSYKTWAKYFLRPIGFGRDGRTQSDKRSKIQNAIDLSCETVMVQYLWWVDAYFSCKYELTISDMYFQGGGWCNNVTTCLARKNTRLGSSKQMATELAFSGILSSLQKFNPGFPRLHVSLQNQIITSFSFLPYNGLIFLFSSSRLLQLE